VVTREECLRVAPDCEAQDRDPEPNGGEGEQRCPCERQPAGIGERALVGDGLPDDPIFDYPLAPVLIICGPASEESVVVVAVPVVVAVVVAVPVVVAVVVAVVIIVVVIVV
jgi:hypothetical protein